jgi:hypothetical protein
MCTVSYGYESFTFFCIRNKIYCIEMYMYSIYSTCILSRSVCPLVVLSHALYRDEVDNPPTPGKYTVLNGNFVFDLHHDLQEHNPGIKWDLSVFVLWFVRLVRVRFV